MAYGVAISPLALPQGPIPLHPNAFYMCEALAGFDLYWASSLLNGFYMGEDISFEIKMLCPTYFYSLAKKSDRNRNPVGFRSARKR